VKVWGLYIPILGESIQVKLPIKGLVQPTGSDGVIISQAVEREKLRISNGAATNISAPVQMDDGHLAAVQISIRSCFGVGYKQYMVVCEPQFSVC
jgi:hypothetical protein